MCREVFDLSVISSMRSNEIPVQLTSSGRKFITEGPLLLRKAADEKLLTAYLGVPEQCLITWMLTSEVPTLKVGPYTYMFAVPDSLDYYAVDFVPGTINRDRNSSFVVLCDSCLLFQIHWTAMRLTLFLV